MTYTLLSALLLMPFHISSANAEGHVGGIRTQANPYVACDSNSDKSALTSRLCSFESDQLKFYEKAKLRNEELKKNPENDIWNKKPVDKVLRSIAEGRANPNDLDYILAASKFSDAQEDWLMKTYLPGFNREETLSVYGAAREQLIIEIDKTSSIPSSSREEMISTIKSIKPMFIDDLTPELSVENKLLLKLTSLMACGYDMPVLQAFYFPIQNNRYFVLCPGLLSFAKLSPLGQNSLFFVIAHELSHSIDTLPYKDLAVLGDALVKKDFTPIYKELSSCWENTLGSRLLKVDELMKGWPNKSAVNSYESLSLTKQLQIGHKPSNIEMHSSEMVADYWATKALRSHMTDFGTPEQLIQQSENLILFDPSISDVDDGLHLPNALRSEWIKVGLAKSAGWCEL